MNANFTKQICFPVFQTAQGPHHPAQIHPQLHLQNQPGVSNGDLGGHLGLPYCQYFCLYDHPVLRLDKQRHEKKALVAGPEGPDGRTGPSQATANKNSMSHLVSQIRLGCMFCAIFAPPCESKLSHVWPSPFHKHLPRVGHTWLTLQTRDHYTKPN